MRDKSITDVKDFGFIAQNLAEVEDAVNGHDWLRITNRENLDQYKINQNRLIPIIVKAIQELSEEVNLLKNKDNLT
jgi:hypothetical protein